MQIGFPTMLEALTPEVSALFCRDMGLDFVELSMNFPYCQIGVLNKDTLRKLRDWTGVYFTLHLEENLSVTDFNPLVRQAYLDTARRALDIALALDMPIVNMHLDKGVYITQPRRKKYLYADFTYDYQTALYDFREMCQAHIGAAPLTMCIENTEGFLKHELAGLAVLLKSGKFALTLDTGHMETAGNADMGFYRANENRIAHMHLHDASPLRCHLPLGEGCLDIAAGLSLARRQNARVVLETKTIQALSDSLAYLKRLDA